MDEDLPLVKNPGGITSVDAVCAHCGCAMIWVDELYLVHANSGKTDCEAA